jgi:MYXO-CTERM domain-containing protein
VDHKIGLPDVTIEQAAQAYLDQGAIFAINHPELDLGDSCIGCAWDHDLSPELIGAVEIATGGMTQGGALFTPRAITFWDELCATGRHIAAIGGSDDHRAGQDLSGFQSPIGDPTTMVLADELSVAGILDAIRNGRTVVKLQGPDDPMIELESSVPPDGDTIAAATITLRARVTGGSGFEVRFVKNGEGLPEIPVGADDFVHELTVDAPADGQDRYRVEVMDGALPRTVTSHLWLQNGTAGSGAVGGDPASPDAGGGCGCAMPRTDRGAWAAVAGAALCALALRRRRRV